MGHARRDPMTVGTNLLPRGSKVSVGFKEVGEKRVEPKIIRGTGWIFPVRQRGPVPFFKNQMVRFSVEEPSRNQSVHGGHIKCPETRGDAFFEPSVQGACTKGGGIRPYSTSFRQKSDADEV